MDQPRKFHEGGIVPAIKARVLDEDGCSHVVPGHRGEVERTLYAGEVVLHFDDPRNNPEPTEGA